MHVEVLKPAQIAEYDRFVANHEHSLVYYCAKYKDLLKDLLQCHEEYLIAVEGDRIRGVLPLLYMEGSGGRVYNSLPFFGSYGGVLADGVVAEERLLGAYDEIATGESTMASTIVSNPLQPQGTSSLRGNYADRRIGQLTALSEQGDSPDHLMERVDASARRNVRKAERQGVSVEVDHTQMGVLREIHETNMRAIGGLAKPERFFELVPGYFVPGEDFDVYVAKKDGAVVAGLLVFYFNLTVEYFVPVVDEQHRPVQPLAIILYTAMHDASQRGFRWWNWGGTWTSQTGVYRFKRKWAAVERHYEYHTQLNEPTLLDWSDSQIMAAFPNFYVVPFDALRSRRGQNGEAGSQGDR